MVPLQCWYGLGAVGKQCQLALDLRELRAVAIGTVFAANVLSNVIGTITELRK